MVCSKIYLIGCFIGFMLLISLMQCSAEGDETQSPASQEPARSKFRLSKVFDFTKYKQLFNKTYSSLVEELARQKLFWAKFFRALISRVKYRHEKSEHYLSINHLSDRTPEELARMHPPASVLAGNLEAMKRGSNAAPKSSEDNVTTADEEEFYDALEEIEENKDRAGFKELAEEVEEATHEFDDKQGNARSRRKRNLEFSRDERLRGDLVEDPDLFESEPSSGLNSEGGIWSYLSKAGNYLPDVVSETAAMLKTSVESSGVSGSISAKPKGDDKVFVDLRESGCFPKPRFQGECGACYAFAAIAMYEWLYCMQTGHLLPFSEQYIIDCGFIENLDGCNGGSLSKTLRFIETYGVELRTNWPYRFKADTCPFDEETNSKTMGYLKVAQKNPSAYVSEALVDVDLKDIPKHLDKPIYHAIMIPSDFAEYGGGVHMGFDCRPMTSHAMLIVGHGIEEGREYYLFRNSYASDWGDSGYFKLSVSAMHTCSVSDTAYQTTSHFPYKTPNEKNRFYDHASVKAHYDSHELGNRYLSFLNLE